MRIGIIGGGPAGIFAALESSTRNNHVVLFDNNPHVGRKLSASGAGRGNLSNIMVSPAAYSSLENFPYTTIVERYNYDFLLDYFNKMGVFTYHTDDGWVYPLSNSAKNFATYLETLLLGKKVEILHSANVVSIDYQKNIFFLKLENGDLFKFDSVILASGGKAHPQLNASTSILKSVEKLGHHILPFHPALAPVKTAKTQSNLLSGVRLDLEVQIMNHEEIIANSYGNVIFTEWGLNGPGIMNISHLIHKFTNSLEVRFNFLNSTNAELIASLLSISKKLQLNFDILLLNIFPQKLVDQLSQNASFNHIDLKYLGNYDPIKQQKTLSIQEKILGTRGFEFAQLSTGGIASQEVNPETLESKIIPGLFFAGELLDVIGPCGGYNLHWAFISGIVAGRSV